MAMNKKEQAAFANLERRLREAKAFRVTEMVAPDVQPPSPGEHGPSRLLKGWLFNVYNDQVNRACTSSVHHNPNGDDRTTSQCPRSLYSTEERALLALRNQVEAIFMKRLVAIDERIEKAMESQAVT